MLRVPRVHWYFVFQLLDTCRHIGCLVWVEGWGAQLFGEIRFAANVRLGWSLECLPSSGTLGTRVP